ncbi:MAG: hypothetical protein ACRC2X_01965, partial [Giesbergeria sp.]
LARTPLGRWGEPEDVAGPVLFLASPDISHIRVETMTAFPMECPLVMVFKRNQRAGNAEAKLYRRS